MIKKNLKNYEGTIVQVIGALGGICTLWKKGKWEMMQQKIGETLDQNKP